VQTTARQWDDWKRTFSRRYSNDEEMERYACFQQNLALIAQRNAQDTLATHGVNQFSDLCPSEFAKMYLGFRPSNGTKAAKAAPVANTTCTGVDWRTSGIVTPVKNQGQCGSCWAFSATGNMEGQWAKAKGHLLSFSEEELVQCVTTSNGCGGGEMDGAFEWVIQNGGIDSEANYPYTSGQGVTGNCKDSKLKSIVASFSTHMDLPHDEQDMAAWVCENGPLSIAVDASSWQTYTGGVVTNNCGTATDMAVLIVGFNAASNPPYWIIKSCWGASWGEAGYIRVEMFQNMCGINSTPCTIGL
jgi:C1A family cysteine protease